MWQSKSRGGGIREIARLFPSKSVGGKREWVEPQEGFISERLGERGGESVLHLPPSGGNLCIVVTKRRQTRKGPFGEEN